IRFYSISSRFMTKMLSDVSERFAKNDCRFNNVILFTKQTISQETPRSLMFTSWQEKYLPFL
ncbi:hypothetical protein, partial [Yersinia aldovae]|uniref:hypothetical protein n=1 Tax=Yersinia aldovae TaxID=29483 RepID=UPI001C9657D1